MGSLIIAILLLVLLVSLFYRNDDNYEKEEKEKAVLARLKAKFQQALTAGDKEQAMRLGRDYYAYLRNSRTLSPEDEQAIVNEIAKMSTHL